MYNLGEKFQGVIHLRHGVSLEQPWDSFSTEKHGTNAGIGQSVYKTSNTDISINNYEIDDEGEEYSDEL